VVNDAAAQGITFKMAYEPEFTLLDGDGEPAHRGPGYSPWALIPAEEFILNLVESLEKQGILPEQIHPEYAMGQYELSIAPLAPVRAADLYVLLRLTIRRLARQHGYYVSFAPVVIRGQTGNGCHLHFSAWKDGQNLMAGGTGPEGLTQEGEALAAGVLEHLYELTAMIAPSVPSYERLQPGHWAGAFTCWGWENREAALRLVKGMAGNREKAANFELKSIDGTSNPYLVPAMLIASAIDGLRRGLRLPAPLQADPATLTDEAQTLHGVRRLPTDLGDAIDELERSSLARATLGQDLFEAFLAVRRLEWETFRERDIDELVEFHRWRYG
jgi:glutamine synthetase